MKEKLSPLLFLAMTAAVVAGFFPKTSGQAATQPIDLSSTAFKQGQNIPDQFTCKGADISPDLWWSGTPKDTQSLVLLVEDPDAAHGPFAHWIVYNIRPDKGDLQANLQSSSDATGLLQGRNSADKVGYTGPCPPKDSGSHHYYFKIYALDSTLNLPAGAEKDAVKYAMTGHVLAQGELLGRYEIK